MPKKTANILSQRQLSMGELVRAALSRILVDSPPNDHNLQGKLITLTQVILSPDLREAKIYVVANGEEENKEFIYAINHASSYFRRSLAGRIDMKFVPKLRFYPDLSFKQGEKIAKILANIY